MENLQKFSSIKIYHSRIKFWPKSDDCNEFEDNVMTEMPDYLRKICLCIILCFFSLSD